MRFNILFGGKAGQGPNYLTKHIAQRLIDKGYYVFYSRDYQSLIRGGHNFNVLTFSDEQVHSNDSKVDVLVCLDEQTEELHKENLSEDGKILKLENNEEFDKVIEVLPIEDKGENNVVISNGSQAIANGAVKSGIDIYYAYPMTPATGILNELANAEGNHLTLELESEVAVVNTGIGSVITGAKVMVGTSGGGFDLMTEGLSLCGIAEVPLVFYLAQRPGPATGVATYTSQGDLNIALKSGHGEFPRVVLAPGNIEECYELINQAFYFSHKFKIPSIVISDKHLAESFYSFNEKINILDIENKTQLERYNSYEKDETGSATENAELIKKNVERRLEKKKQIVEEVKKFKAYKVYGREDFANVVVGWGSTKGAIIDAIKNLDVKFVQVLYLEPFADIKKELEGKNILLVENNSTGQLGSLIAEKTGIFIDDKNKILRYDGRPFLADELADEIKERLK